MAPTPPTAATGPVPRHDSAGVELAGAVFGAVADRFEERAGEIARFVATGGSFEPWCVWEAAAGLLGRDEGWSVRPQPPYAELGVTGSRDAADLLVFDTSRGIGIVVEIVVIHDWTRNTWLDRLDGDTDKLGKTLSPGLVPLQLVLAASIVAPVEVNPTWQQWLGMSKIWNRPTGLSRSLPLGPAGQLIMQGWILTGS